MLSRLRSAISIFASSVWCAPRSSPSWIDVRAERPGPVVLGAGLRGVGGRGRVVVRGDEPRPEVGRAALERVELVAQVLPAGELFGVGGPVALADAAQRVARVADGLDASAWSPSIRGSAGWGGSASG